jgi:tRNA-2-methylthio-N6-dimethylallyladenosine synthase
MSLKFFIKTYGCQMNERDSEMIAALLQRAGFTLAGRENNADIVIVNTCSVREKAEVKALGKLRLLIAEKRRRKNLVVGAVGCMVQRMKTDILRQTRGLDFAVGTSRISSVGEIIQKVLSGRRPVVDVAPGKLDCEPDTHLAGNVAAFINVLYGCNRHCSYCVVPEVRGPEWSRPAADIVAEAQGLVAKGTKEITLLGQSVLSYGRANEVWQGGPESQRGFKEPFPRLLEAVSSISGLARLRFTSSHPSGCTEELARAFMELPAVCPHVHLPLQSGSDRLLKLMNRGYTAPEYRAAVGRLRRAAPRLAITTDIIVGYPSETKEDFDLTRAFMEEIGFVNAFIFKYSPRPGTKAAKLADDVSPAEKLRWNHILLEDLDRQGLKLNRLWVGRAAQVLVEGQSRRNPNRWSGHTDTNIIVIFENTGGIRPGDLIEVKIERAEAQTLYGKVEGRM